jgi:hypothetical protein
LSIYILVITNLDLRMSCRRAWRQFQGAGHVWNHSVTDNYLFLVHPKVARAGSSSRQTEFTRGGEALAQA